MLDTQNLTGLNPDVQNFLLTNGIESESFSRAVQRSAYAPNLNVQSLLQTSATRESKSGGEILRGSAESNFLSSKSGNDSLYGLAGDDILGSGNGNDLLNGGTGRDLLLSGSGDNILIDDDGGDLMLGGSGRDQFWIEAWNAPATPSAIANFQPDLDQIKIRRLGANINTLTFQDTEQGVIVLDQGQAIASLLDIKAADLSADQFIFGAPELANQFQSGLEQSIQQTGTPGATNAVVTPDGFTWKGAAGVSDLAQQTPLQSDDVFNIASTTKSFTAATVLKVVEAGKISLDDTLGQWLPEIAQNIPDGNSITLRQLLNGTSGVPNFDETQQYRDDLVNGRITTLTSEQAIAYVYGQPRFSGSRSSSTWTYTNTGDILASLMVEKATGQPFSTVMREQVLNPLGLNHTFFGGQEELPDTVARAYQDVGSDGVLDDVSEANTLVISNFGAAGALFSTAEEVTRFTQSLFGGELLSTSSVQELTRFVDTNFPGVPQYGLGVINTGPIGEFPTQWILAGDSLGTKAETVYFPDLSGTTFTTLTNRQSLFETTPASTTTPILTSNLTNLRDQIAIA